MRRRKRRDAGEARYVLSVERARADHQEVGQAVVVRTRWNLGVREQRLDLGREREESTALMVVEGPYAECVPGEHKPLIPRVEHGDGEIAVQMLGESPGPLL